METIRFKNDTATRRRLFDPESFAHPAKGQTGMWQTMIERYSKVGDLVLDPMSGTGVTMLAALMGRNVVCVELEQHFVDPMRRSWAKMRQHPMLGYETGSVCIIRGDARALPLRSADVILTSPPWQIQDSNQPSWQLARDVKSGMWDKGLLGYTRPPQVDCVVTSPPWEDMPVANTEWMQREKKEGRLSSGERFALGAVHNINAGSVQPSVAENIGNLRSAAYWEAMQAVYAEAWRVIKPGGIMALVLKGFTRDGKYVDLPGQTEALLLAAGWVKHDEWRRELWALSFWRVLQRRRDPAAFDDRLLYETVLAFTKPGDVGDGVAAILTSPPYEGSITEGHDGIDWAKSADSDRSSNVSRKAEGTGRARGYTRPGGAP